MGTLKNRDLISVLIGNGSLLFRPKLFDRGAGAGRSDLGDVFVFLRRVTAYAYRANHFGFKFMIRADSRAVFIAPTYLRRFAHRRSEILPAGKLLKLVETGNHAQGCIFRDGGNLRTDALERVVDNISRKLPGFYIGRYDVRYDNEEEFKAGRNFQIVELNGASSEATSIYDARNSLISAYRTLFRQWKTVFAIGAVNRALGWSPSPLRTLWREWRQYSLAALSYPCAS